MVSIIRGGVVRVGDPLHLHHAGPARAVSCHAVGLVDEVRRSRELPALLGLPLLDLEPFDALAGDELTCPGMSD